MTSPAPAAPGDLARLAIHLDTGFVTSPAGRLSRVNAPDGGPAPRLVLAACAGGRLARVRQDADAATAAMAAELAASPGPWNDPATEPAIPAALIDRLKRTGPIGAVDRRWIHDLPMVAAADTPAGIVACHTPGGAALLRRLARDGMPGPLVQAGFLSVADVWPPWCVALEDGEIAAIAFAARLGRSGADVGVHTVPAFRGRGLGAAVTAAWSSLPDLGGRRRFYTVFPANASSLRVVGRLGLPRLGAAVSVA